MITATYAIRFDASEKSYPWDVVDADGDVFDSFATRAEAVAYVQDQKDDDDAAEIRQAVADKMEGMDVTSLRALAAFLNL